MKIKEVPWTNKRFSVFQRTLWYMADSEFGKYGPGIILLLSRHNTGVHLVYISISLGPSHKCNFWSVYDRLFLYTEIAEEIAVFLQHGCRSFRYICIEQLDF